MSKSFDFEVYKSISLKLSKYRHHAITCSVSNSSDGIHSIHIGDLGGWFYNFCTNMVGDDCSKVNNCLCWRESSGNFRAVYANSFCKFGDILLYSTATGKTKKSASLSAINSWMEAKIRIIEVADNE